MLKNVFKYLWQFPQTILGIIVILIMKARYSFSYKGKKVFVVRHAIGVSFGEFIILHKGIEDFSEKERAIPLKHEYGHSRQSMRWGFLYLLIVGLPSITMNILSRIGVLNRNRYYNRYPENKADELGGVIRKVRDVN